MYSPRDHELMTRALELAREGLFSTSPNPRVGCVIVREDRIVGEGWHRRAGEAHAEIVALGQAGSQARGATVYLSLEPCSHFGRTPPCVDALIEAHVARVLVAMEDPNAQVNGRGLERLRAAGVDVRCGLLRQQAEDLNVGFVSRMTRGRPWVRLKVAASLDGGTALRNGNSQWITGEPARRDAHAWRARACAVLTGIGTVREDDPRLDVRHVDTPRQPLKVVVDSRLEIALHAQLLRGGSTLIFTAAENPGKEQELGDRGAEVVRLANADGKVDLEAMLQELGRREINELHVEAGFRLNGSLVREHCVDEFLVFLAPRLLGDARAMFDLPPLERLADARQLEFTEVERVGDDLRLLARWRRS